MPKTVSKKLPLSNEEIERIEAKISGIENIANVEVRVILTNSSWLGIRNKARKYFKRFGLDKTDHQNGVMILLDIKNHELLLYGDISVHTVVGQSFWEEMRISMIEELKNNQLADAICLGLHKLGEKLSNHMPIEAKKADVLSNEIIFDL